VKAACTARPATVRGCAERGIGKVESWNRSPDTRCSALLRRYSRLNSEGTQALLWPLGAVAWG
jgi:hypothetical protein